MWFRIAKRLRYEDRAYIVQATECAKQKRQDIDEGLFDFLRDVLTMEVKGKQETEFVLRFQQFTGPVMAKGVEDTAFYCYNRLTGLNEVGNDPGRNGLSVAEFHAYCEKMQATHPVTMTALATHDTKRSDDVRARLAVLSEMPGRFGGVAQRWSRMNREFRTSDYAGSEYGVSVLPDFDWCVAAAGGSCAGLHAEGRARGEGADDMGRQ